MFISIKALKILQVWPFLLQIKPLLLCLQLLNPAGLSHPGVVNPLTLCESLPRSRRLSSLCLRSADIPAKKPIQIPQNHYNSHAPLRNTPLPAPSGTGRRSGGATTRRPIHFQVKRTTSSTSTRRFSRFVHRWRFVRIPFWF